MSGPGPFPPLPPDHLCDSIPDAVVAIDASGIVLAWNAAAEALLGRRAADVVGRPVDPLIPEELRAGFRGVVARALREGPIRGHRAIHRREDGTTFPIDVDLGTLVGPDGAPAGVTLVIRDATAREQMVRTLRDSVERLRILFNQGDDAVFVVMAATGDSPGRFIEVNDAACRRYGYTREEFLRMTPRDLDAPELAERIPLAMERLAKGGQALFETVHVARDGRRIPVEINAVLFEIDGKPAISAIARDLARRDEYEDALRRSEEQFRSVVDSCPMGTHLYRLDPDGRLLFIHGNSAGNLLAGADCSALAGLEALEAFPGLVGTGVTERYREVIRTGVPWHVDRIDYNDERIHGSFELFVFRTAPDSMAVMFLDVTERQRLQAQALEARDLLISQMRNHEEFVLEVAHRLRNPLQILTGYLSVFPGEEDLSPEQWVAMGTLRAAVQRIEEDIKGLTS